MRRGLATWWPKGRQGGGLTGPDWRRRGGGGTLYIVKVAGPSPATPPLCGQVLPKSPSVTTSTITTKPCHATLHRRATLPVVASVQRSSRVFVIPAKGVSSRHGKWVGYGQSQLALSVVTGKINFHIKTRGTRPPLPWLLPQVEMARETGGRPAPWIDVSLASRVDDRHHHRHRPSSNMPHHHHTSGASSTMIKLPRKIES